MPRNNAHVDAPNKYRIQQQKGIHRPRNEHSWKKIYHQHLLSHPSIFIKRTKEKKEVEERKEKKKERNQQKPKNHRHPSLSRVSPVQA